MYTRLTSTDSIRRMSSRSDASRAILASSVASTMAGSIDKFISNATTLMLNVGTGGGASSSATQGVSRGERMHSASSRSSERCVSLELQQLDLQRTLHLSRMVAARDECRSDRGTGG